MDSIWGGGEQRQDGAIARAMRTFSLPINQKVLTISPSYAIQCSLRSQKFAADHKNGSASRRYHAHDTASAYKAQCKRFIVACLNFGPQGYCHIEKRTPVMPNKYNQTVSKSISTGPFFTLKPIYSAHSPHPATTKHSLNKKCRSQLQETTSSTTASSDTLARSSPSPSPARTSQRPSLRCLTPTSRS